MLHALADVVRELTDGTFEHDTQAATGATTGDWVVEFYSETCAMCADVDPIFESVAGSLEQRVMFAKMNVDSNPLTAQRFAVDRELLILMFSKGKMYRFQGKVSTEKLRAFASGDFKSENGVVVPVEATLWDRVYPTLEKWWTSIRKQYLPTDNHVYVASAAAILLLVFLISSFCMKKPCRGASGPSSSTRSRARKKD